MIAKCNERVKSALIYIFIFIVAQPAITQSDNSSYRICILREQLSACEQMQKNVYSKTQKIKCVPANDKIDCIRKVARNEADFLPLQPEEVYAAHRYSHLTFQKNAFVVISEIRTVTYKTRNYQAWTKPLDYRYKAVAVVRKSSKINSISDLKGKKSCHLGFGQIAGWKVPFSNLMDKNEIAKLCEGIHAPTSEKDLYAMSKYFGSACAPGSWDYNSEKDHQLKEKYSNLCALCNSANTCDWDDTFGGDEGALKCLTLKNADVAWTKMDAVEKFFKLNEPTPSENVWEYNFLCLDGSSMPLTSKKPCSWASRPWRSFLARSLLSSESIADLQSQISLLIAQADEQKQTSVTPSWLKDVLEFSTNDKRDEITIEYHLAPKEAKLLTPEIYLTRNNNFLVTIEKPSCGINSTIKFCVQSPREKSKCMALHVAAMGRSIFPALECILGKSTKDCIQKVANGEADVINLDPKDADWAKKNYGLEGILSELENVVWDKYPYRYALAVINTDNAGDFKNISDIKEKRTCHGSIKSIAGWNAPLTVLRDNRQIKGPNCRLPIEMSKYFNQSCVPGVPEVAINMPLLPQKQLCALCVGDGSLPRKAVSSQTKCANNDTERYYGDEGALTCLQDGVADIAFTDHVALYDIAQDPKSTLNLTVKLLCPDGNTMDVADYEHCNWGKVPSRKIVTRGGEKFRTETLLHLVQTFGPGGKIFKLFSPYFGKKNLLFQDTSVGLIDDSLAISDKLISDFDNCDTSCATTSLFYITLSILSILLNVFPHYLV